MHTTLHVCINNVHTRCMYEYGNNVCAFCTIQQYIVRNHCHNVYCFAILKRKQKQKSLLWAASILYAHLKHLNYNFWFRIFFEKIYGRNRWHSTLKLKPIIFLLTFRNSILIRITRANKSAEKKKLQMNMVMCTYHPPCRVNVNPKRESRSTDTRIPVIPRPCGVIT